MRPYELTILISPDMENHADLVLDKVEKLIADCGGHITNKTDEGKKRLAYAIQKQDFALYYYYELELPVLAPAKISSVLNITDKVLRYLLVGVDPRKIKAEAKRQARKLKTEENNQEN